MALEHRVYAVPPDHHEPIYMASYTLERWQWAEKFGQFLRDSNYSRVEVRTVDEGEEK